MADIKTLQVRVKDKHAALLTRMSQQVNFVWNYLNETSQKAILDRKHFMSGYDLQKLCSGYTSCEGILLVSGTVETVCDEYVTRRRKFKRIRLNWRVSNRASSRYSLGWVPFKAKHIRYRSGQVVYAGHRFSVWDSYGLGDYDLRAGSFSQDARGRWYFNVAVQVSTEKSEGTAALGIDLGLKTAVTTSDGQTFTGRLYRASEAKLSKAQRANKKRLARTINAKIKNQRKDGLHKFSTKLVSENAAIFVGDVSSKKMLKTTMAKSTQDAGWAMFKTMLEQKCRQAGVVFGVVNEAWSTQTCNVCGVIAGPKGRAGLNERMWACSCGAVHDRDVNAALNIRARGLAGLEAGAALVKGAEKPNQAEVAALAGASGAAGEGAEQ
jgi:putative transposase